ncbi:RNA methyltransferase [Thalassobacillus sp. CUG 92003]|uniref:TrmH family RNA methyltransferase n=1 Tax=Thalassobacillus sp. CUG 92003 TaxID=2736641 RepID=UPI0015E647D7|nr:RNA methyltransferase [Thalassobacillus sp. CUG 92003]
MLTSTQNTKVKDWKKLHQRKYRKQSQSFLVEGFHLVEEAVTSDWVVREIIINEHTELPDWAASLQVSRVSTSVFYAIAETKSPQGIAAVVEMKHVPWRSYDRVIMLDGVQDPGNAGTIIRTADAAGFDAVVLGTGSVDLYNDKVVRSTQGSLFHLDMFEGTLSDYIQSAKEMSSEIWGAALEGAAPYKTCPVPDKLTLVLGNEGSGLQPDVADMTDQLVTIPILGKAESLNVSTASAILMYYIQY